MDRRFHGGAILCSSTRSKHMAEAKLDGFSVLRSKGEGAAVLQGSYRCSVG
jgi:hypothetical protein